MKSLVYSNGASERIVGKAIKQFEIPRHKVVILTKCYAPVGESPDIFHMKYYEQLKTTKDYVNHYGIFNSVIF